MTPFLWTAVIVMFLIICFELAERLANRQFPEKSQRIQRFVMEAFIFAIPAFALGFLLPEGASDKASTGGLFLGAFLGFAAKEAISWYLKEKSQ